MMKTFTFLFFVLSLINIPIYGLYLGVTRNNNYMDLGLSFISLGNLGQTNPTCSHTKLLPVAPSTAPITLTCDDKNEYLSTIDDFGMLYIFDLEFNKKSDGEKKCQQIMKHKTLSELSVAGRILEESESSFNISMHQSFQPRRILVVDEDEDEHKINRINVTRYNFDSECRQQAPSFFKSDKETKKKISDYFKENCYG